MDDPRPRISRIDWNGTPAWLKHQEVLPLRYRIQKGNPAKLFAAEKAIYRKLADLGLSGPEVLDEGPDHLVIKDAGTTLQTMLRKQDRDSAKINAALTRVALAMADLHQSGVAHGRPAPRDICIQDGRVTFLDWERYNARRNDPKGFANDFVIWVYFTIVLAKGVPASLGAACTTYLENVPPQVFAEICKRTGRLSFWQKVLSPLLNKFAHKPDIGAVRPTMGFLRDEICSQGR